MKMKKCCLYILREECLFVYNVILSPSSLKVAVVCAQASVASRGENVYKNAIKSTTSPESRGRGRIQAKSKKEFGRHMYFVVILDVVLIFIPYLQLRLRNMRNEEDFGFSCCYRPLGELFCTLTM